VRNTGGSNATPRGTASPAVAGAILLALAATGCVMPDQMSQLQKDVADVRQQLDRVEREQAELRQALDTAATAKPQEPAVGHAEFADLSFRVDQLARESEITDERLSDLSRQLERMAREVEASRALARPAEPLAEAGAATGDEASGSTLGELSPATPAAGSAAAAPNANDLYNTAYTDFSKGNYALAISGFQEFEERYPDNPLADNALYWVGECHFSQGDFDAAIESFDAMLERYPQSDKAAAANLKKGLAYLEQNRVRQAIVQLQHVRETYPGSDEAKIARDKLTSLGAPLAP